MAIPKSIVKIGKPGAAICPYCALLCDDLVVQRQTDNSLAVLRNGCSRADADFGRPPPAADARIEGEAVALDVAIAAAARTLKRARMPLFAGLGTDVDGMRAIIDLGEQCGATLDHMHGDALDAMSRVLQTRGWYATTLSEVRNRADLVVVVDVELDSRYENFSRRCLRPSARLRPGKKSQREVVFVGQRARLSATLEPDRCLHCSAEALHDVLLALLATLKQHTLDARRPGGVGIAAVRALAEAMRGAEYCTVVFAPGSLGADRESLIATLCDIVDELNSSTRAAVLALGGDDGGQSAVGTCSWLTGYPLRTTFAKTLRYEPLTNRTQSLLAAQAVDALLWVDAYGRQPAPPPGVPPANTIVLAAAPPDKPHYGVFIPVGTPGVDHFARLVRTDSVVTLPLRQQRDCALPSVAEIIKLIFEAR